MLSAVDDYLALDGRSSPGSARAETAPERVAPEKLHPSLWLAHQLGRHGDAVVPSGFAALDTELPGGG
jgi:protein ImuA